MKKILTMALVAATVLSACTHNDKNTLRVKMDVPGFGDTVKINGGPEELVFVGKDGKFEFEVEVDTPFMAVLYQPKMERGEKDDVRYYRVPFVGGDEMCLRQTTPERYDVDGTGFYADYHKVDLFVEEAIKPVHEMSKKYHEMDADETISEEEKSAFFEEKIVGANRKFWQALVDYAKEHPKQEAVVPFLDECLGDGELYTEAFNSLDASVRKGRMKVFYDRWLKSCEEYAKKRERDAEAAKKQEAGLEAPTFTLNDINGKPLSLESLRGKYVILDFWGSWCGWCIKGFPRMKEYYAKYEGKFEILGIDCNDTEEAWKAAVEKHQVPWLHVYCPKDATVENDYGISSYPTKVIIGPDGKIVKSIVGEDPAFYTLLDELFGN
jgi:thiol-disulfide isomerase/thioredoxin